MSFSTSAGLTGAAALVLLGEGGAAAAASDIGGWDGEPARVLFAAAAEGPGTGAERAVGLAAGACEGILVSSACAPALAER